MIHLCEIYIICKLIQSDRKQASGCLGLGCAEDREVAVTKGHKNNLQEININCGDGFMSKHQKCILKICVLYCVFIIPQ